MKKQLDKTVTLKHLLINNEKMIGLQFYPDKAIQLVIKNFDGIKWSPKYKLAYLPNKKSNVDKIYTEFKGIAWINSKYFFKNTLISKDNGFLDLNGIRNRKKPTEYRRCPESFLQKLELKQYAPSTAKTYIAMFEKFINYYKDTELIDLNENDIRKYMMIIIREGKSISYQNQMVNSIKFYYEIVLNMPHRLYEIERPRKEHKLPKVISKKEVLSIIEHTNNIKHKCIVSLLYSAGLRRSELINLKLNDIDSERMVILVRNSKGNKERLTILSKNILEDLRKYYIEWKPKEYLFEGKFGGKYSTSSVGKIVKDAAKLASINKTITPHILRHCFATHLLEAGTDLRYIQTLLGHNSTRTTEIYTQVAINNIKIIKSPLD